MMEEKSTPVSIADVLANVRCMQTTVLQTEAEQKQLADQKYRDEQQKFLDTIIRQITIRSCNRYIIFEIPKPADKKHTYDMTMFAIKQIYNTFDKEYCLYNVIRNKRSLYNMSPGYSLTKITIDRDGRVQNKRDTSIFLLYDRRRFINNVLSDMMITDAEFDECTK